MQHFSLNALRDNDDFDCLTISDLPRFISIDNLTGRMFNWVYRWEKIFLYFEQEIVCIKQRVISRLFNIVIQ